MLTVTLSATPKGNGYQATVTFPDGVSISSAETYPSIAEAITAAALKLLAMPKTIRALLGHGSQTVTQDYVHIDEALKLAAARACEEVVALLAGKTKQVLPDQP